MFYILINIGTKSTIGRLNLLKLFSNKMMIICEINMRINYTIEKEYRRIITKKF